MFYLMTHSTFYLWLYGTKEWRIFLFNDTLNTFYLWLYVRKEEMFYLMTHSTHFIYDYMEEGKEEEMFYLMTHSTHFIYDYMEGRNVLFNDTLNTFYLWLYGRKEEMFYLMMPSAHFIYDYNNGVRHMAEEHSASERGNPLLPLHELFFSISSKGSFICTISQTG